MELLTVDDTAEALKVSTTTVRRFIADGRLPAVKVGKVVRVRREAVEQLAQPVQPKARRERSRARPMTADDPMSKLVGSVTDAPPTDSSKKYEYLADAITLKQR
ncbi:MAG TPA: helix-turn-helix domain-containing protein [Chloroflexota bacterium]|nr:helix-turn-helix domain-containing protein [Chloroflexota bacterium]